MGRRKKRAPPPGGSDARGAPCLVAGAAAALCCARVARRGRWRNRARDTQKKECRRMGGSHLCVFFVSTRRVGSAHSPPLTHAMDTGRIQVRPARDVRIGAALPAPRTCPVSANAPVFAVCASARASRPRPASHFAAPARKASNHVRRLPRADNEARHSPPTLLPFTHTERAARNRARQGVRRVGVAERGQPAAVDGVFGR